MEPHVSSTEIGPNIFRLSVAPNTHFEFSQFLLNDSEPCLIHTGKSSLFNPLKKLVKTILEDRPLKHIVFSHVEADESGAANKWLDEYPEAQVTCNKVSSISLDDFLIRDPQIFKDGDNLNLGSMNLKMIETPHFPHNWDAHMWYEEKNKILFSSDFCCQGGINEPVIEKDISATIIDFYDKVGFMSYGSSTNEALAKLNKLQFNAIAPMHGSIITGGVSRTVFDKVCIDLKERA